MKMDAIGFLLRRAREHEARADAIRKTPNDGTEDWHDAMDYSHKLNDLAYELRECADILRTPRSAVKESDYAKR